jgi:hypothetical protein
MQNALAARLAFRASFLAAVEAASSRSSPDTEKLWMELLKSLTDIKTTAQLGVPAASAFSVKIQRKLASTVPPHPMVEVGQDAAFSHLERLCKDAAAASAVLRYYDSHSLMVCDVYRNALMSLTVMADLRVTFPGSKTTTFRLCSNTTSTLHFWRNGNPRDHVYSSGSR